jgi:hypothetical protein
MTKFLSGRGLDIGTSFIICAKEYATGGKVMYTEFRDAFIRLVPSSPIAKKMMLKGLKGQRFFEDTDGSYVVVGQDAIERAIERNISANRPLVRGVISPKEKQARRILRHILKEILGQPQEADERLVYSVPSQPVDQPGEAFDVGFHIDALNNDLRALGFAPTPLPEAEAICYSELEGTDYTGLCFSFGAGMVNACLMSSGEGIVHYSTTRSGDWLDRMAAQATATADTVVQVEKENTQFQLGQEVQGRPVLSAVSFYYIRLIDYTVQHLVRRLQQSDDLPNFTTPLPIILAGGTSQASGFVEQFLKRIDLEKDNLPFSIAEVRLASNPLRAVSRGCLLAAQL